MRTSLIVAAPLILVAAGCGPSGGQGGSGGGMPPAQVSTMTVAPKALPAPFEYTGQTAGSREVEVRARVRGILVSRNFTEGGSVKQGGDGGPTAPIIKRAQ